ncbi:MAG: recombinase family protein [Clostridia bacterium]|nr:recombinase family protein [Clostridia bacterium]
MEQKRAVAYIRVSSKSKAQSHSYEFQEFYWRNEIAKRSDLELVNIYADYGISGKTIRKRPQFLQMIEDCRQGKIDVIYTKSIQRFGRNTEELIGTVKKLRGYGVNVIFEKEQIDTAQPNSDLFLTIGAAVAENDLRIYSDNQRWSMRKKFADGYVFIGHSIYGYKMNKENNTLEIEPEQAKVVKKIFDLYLQGKGRQSIAKELEKDGILSPTGNTEWNENSVVKILKNEKYKGCCLSQKTLMIDGERLMNDNLAPQYYMENTHEAIVPAEIFDNVQAKMERNKLKKKVRRLSETPYPFAKMIKCGLCGKYYQHKINNSGTNYAAPMWICSKRKKYGVAGCDSSSLYDNVLRDKFVECYNEFITTKAKCEDEEILWMSHKKLLDSEYELNTLYINKLITADAYRKEIKEIKDKITDLDKKISSYQGHFIKKSDYVTISEFDEDKVNKFLKEVTVINDRLIFAFINGAKISRKFANRVPWNKKTYKELNYGNTQKSST